MRDRLSLVEYFLGRAFAADVLTFLLWKFYGLAALPGFLALSTFHPFDFSYPVLGAVALAAAGFASVFAVFAGLRSRTLAAFGWPGDERRPGFPILLSSRAALPGEWRPRLLLPLAATALLPPLLSALLLGGTHLVWHARFASLESGLRGDGLPATLASFSADTAAPGDYAFGPLEQALGKFEDGFLKSLPYRKTAFRKWDRAMYDNSSRAAAHYAAFLEAELLPLLPRHTRFRPIDYAAVSADPDALPEFSPEKYMQAARLLRLGALARAYEGDRAGAWARLESLFALADLLSSDPGLDVKMVALTLRGEAVEAAVTALRNLPGATLPPRLAVRLQEFDGDGMVGGGARFELARRLDFRRAYEFPIITGAKKMVSLGCSHHGESRDGEEQLLNMGARLLVLAGAFDAGYFRLAQHLAGQARGAAEPGENGLQRPWPLWPYTIAQFERPQYWGFYQKETDFKAWARLALTASALEAQRRSGGRYPAVLPGAPAHFIDPYSGRPFEYSTAASGRSYTACSGGPEGDRRYAGEEAFCVTQSY